MSEPLVQTYATRSGPMLALTTDHYITRSLELYGEYCPDEWRLLRQLIRSGMTVVEVGANIGAHSVDMARACAPGIFYAFEPQPRVFQILCANLALNDVGNARAYPDACGSAEGEATVPLVDYARKGNFGGVGLQPADRQGIKVRVRPLDALDLQACGLIKVDVQGFELEVIRGARATIARCRPVLYVENDRPAEQPRLIPLIASLGYRLYWHAPALWSPDNFKGVQDNVFGTIASTNMLCIPAERSATRVDGLREITLPT